MLHRIPLYQKLSILMAAVAVAVTLAYAALASWSSDRYHQEATQKLHQALASYVLAHQPSPLLTTDRLNTEGLKALAMNTMMINPQVEVYLLNAKGDILGHALPEAAVVAGRVDLAPVRRFLALSAQEASPGPIYGQNPRQPEQSAVFSAAAVEEGGKTIGYLYIVLASHQASSLIDQLQDSHILRMTLAGAIMLMVFLLLCAMLSFRLISGPVRVLNREVRRYREQEFVRPPTASQNPAQVSSGDEVQELRQSIHLMQERIKEQFDQLASADRLRRELISNVSHDLRTPLATMQGYLETLLLKQALLTDEDRHQYTRIAFRHSQHMGKLVSQLFELSKLDAGKVEPRPEVFSLKELVYDLLQDYELQAGQRQIRLAVEAPETDVLVQADIELMQRVLQNLMDNALRHTPEQGHVEILLKELPPPDNLPQGKPRIQVCVADSGAGIAPEDLPYVFDRHFQSDTSPPPVSTEPGTPTTVSSGSGLGLSIVKRILELHNARIQVSSLPQQGARFSFELPLAI